MDKPNITKLVYVDNKVKRDLLQSLKDSGVVLPVNLYIQKDGSVLYIETVEEEEEKKENKEKQIIEKIDEDGNTYFDLI